MRKHTLFLLLLFFNLSCNSIINTAYNDTAAKYNAYFLSEESIEEIEEELLSLNDENYDSLINLSYEIDTNRVSGLNEKKDDIVKKLSILIQRHEGSKYVYPSYALIGKARLLSQEINESITTLKYVNSKSSDQFSKQMSLIYLMRAYTEKKDFDSALEVYNFLKKQTIDKDLVLEYHLYSHYLFKKTNNIEGIFNELLSIEKFAKKKNLINRVYFAIGQIYLLKREFELAQNYFKKCLSNNPSFEIEFNAKLFYAKSLSQGEPETISNFYDKLIRDKKNIEDQDRIYYEIGQYDYDKGDIEGAIMNFKVSAEKNKNKKKLLFYTYLNIADIFYEESFDYKSAKLYYDSALNNINREYSDYEMLKSKSEVLNELVENLDLIRLNDSLIYLTTIPESDLNEIIQNKIQADKKNKKIRVQSQKNQNYIPEESKVILSNSGGEWYFNNLSIVSIGINDFKRIWGSRDLTDNWRLASKMNFNNELSDSVTKQEDSIPIDLQADTDEKLSFEEMKSSLPFNQNEKDILLSEIEEASYKLGKIYIQKLKEIKKGIDVYTKFIERFSASKYLAEIYYQLYLLEENNQKYKDIILSNYTETEYYKLIINPYYKVDEFQELNFLKRSYNELYDNLIKGNNKYVISVVDSLGKTYEKNPFFENLLLLRTIGIGKISGNFTLQFELKSFLNFSKNESSKNYASTLLLSAEEVHKRFIFSGLPKFYNNIDSRYFFIILTEEADEIILSILNESIQNLGIPFDIYKFNLTDNLYFNALTYSDFKTLKRLEKEFNLNLDNTELKGNTNFVVGEKNMNLIFKSKNYNEFRKFYNK